MRRLPILSASLDRGFILITSLLFTVVIALMAISMLRSYGVLQRRAANIAEKQRAFQAAQSALSFGEWWLTQGNGAIAPVQCSSLVTASAALGGKAAGQICKNALPSPLTLPLAAGVTYTPPSMTVSTAGGLDVSGNTNYARSPQMYIQSLGYAADGRALFQVTGIGFGGSSQTVAITQSTFGLSTGVKNLGGQL